MTLAPTASTTHITSKYNLFRDLKKYLRLKKYYSFFFPRKRGFCWFLAGFLRSNAFFISLIIQEIDIKVLLIKICFFRPILIIIRGIDIFI